MPGKAHSIDYRLEIVDGYMRPVVEGMDAEQNELLWDFLLPFPASAAALLEDVEAVERGESEEIIIASTETRITCGPKSVVIEDWREHPDGREPSSVTLPLKDAASLLRRWVFECVWREQQIREQAEIARG